MIAYRSDKLTAALRHIAIVITQREDAILLAFHAGEVAQEAVFCDMGQNFVDG